MFRTRRRGLPLNIDVYKRQILDGGLNEMFGIDKGMNMYNNQFMNVDLGKGVTLKVSGGLKIKLIPAN